MTNRALLDLDALPALFRHRVAAATDLIALGLSGREIAERCSDDGPWRHLRSGLVLLAGDPPTRAQRVQAALTAAGEDAILTGVDALTCHGLRAAGLDGPVHVLMPPRRHSRLVDGVFFERSHTLPVPQLRSGFPVAPLARATVDTCRRATSAEHVRALLSEAIRHGRVSPAALRVELVRTGTRGTALPHRILAEIDDGASALITGWARRLLVKAGLPAPRWRSPVSGPAGGYLATPDAWWEEANLAWEITSYSFDPSPVQVNAALAAANRLAAAGILVIHTPPTQLRDEPARVVELLRDAYRRSLTEPGPAVPAAA
ncbi:hypothetical protein [Actinophytocola xinjiangensis]|uniref:hypothetical protein n=1 Tax=Actinophytocola xinjiangensis TaxID=485602 RepID=UPI0009FEAA8A|nr:hypothetical protein [Actinophytocola xinjiangensis]